ncbi:Peptidase family M23 [compost metagenome]
MLYAKEGVPGIGIPKEMGIVVAIKDDKGYLHVYAHLSAAVVKVGQTVERGQMIGM